MSTYMVSVRLGFQQPSTGEEELLDREYILTTSDHEEASDLYSRLVELAKVEAKQ